MTLCLSVHLPYLGFLSAVLSYSYLLWCKAWSKGCLVDSSRGQGQPNVNTERAALGGEGGVDVVKPRLDLIVLFVFFFFFFCGVGRYGHFSCCHIASLWDCRDTILSCMGVWGQESDDLYLSYIFHNYLVILNHVCIWERAWKYQ